MRIGTIFINAILLVGMGAVVARAQVSLPYYADFETAQSYTAGNLSGQGGWQVTQGTASVITSQYFSGAQSVQIDSGATPGRIAQTFNQLTGQNVIFIDFYVKPVADTSAGTASLTITDSAKVSLVTTATGGRVYCYKGNGSVFTASKFSKTISRYTLCCFTCSESDG